MVFLVINCLTWSCLNEVCQCYYFSPSIVDTFGATCNLLSRHLWPNWKNFSGLRYRFRNEEIQTQILLFQKWKPNHLAIHHHLTCMTIWLDFHLWIKLLGLNIIISIKFMYLLDFVFSTQWDFWVTSNSGWIFTQS